jgi:hypothetical protein
MKEASVKSPVLLNPSEAKTPGNGVGWVPLGTGCAITYPRSSLGPFHHPSPVEVNPVVGVPTARDPICSVPAIGAPVLYENGLDVLILIY